MDRGGGEEKLYWASFQFSAQQTFLYLTIAVVLLSPVPFSLSLRSGSSMAKRSFVSEGEEQYNDLETEQESEIEEDEGEEEEEKHQREKMIIIRVVSGGERRGFQLESNSDNGSGGIYLCCQADECGKELVDAKAYHRRHKVCERHAKAPVVLVKGVRQRFCQQCSR